VFRLAKQKLPIHGEELRDGRKCAGYLTSTNFNGSMTGVARRSAPLNARSIIQLRRSGNVRVCSDFCLGQGNALVHLTFGSEL
jgi:hypothetical protein